MTAAERIAALARAPDAASTAALRADLIETAIRDSLPRLNDVEIMLGLAEAAGRIIARAEPGAKAWLASLAAAIITIRARG